MKHVDFAEILDVLEGRADETTGSRTNNHLKSCSDCAAARQSAERMLEAMRAPSQLYDAPEYVISRALELLPAARKQGFADWIRARLEFDSFTAPAMAGVRSAKTAGPRHFTYATEAYKIHLMQENRDKQALITGQLTANAGDVPANPCLVEVSDSKKVLNKLTTGKSGEFAFEAPRGRQIHIRFHGAAESVLLSCRF